MKVRKHGSWQQWKKTCKIHGMEVIGTHIAVILAVFIIAAVIQFSRLF